jgi:hypothetical protein
MFNHTLFPQIDFVVNFSSQTQLILAVLLQAIHVTVWSRLDPSEIPGIQK